MSGGEGATVGWIEKGEWLEFTTDVIQSGLYTLKFRYSSGNPNGGGPFTLQAQDLIITDSIYVPSTSSSNWDTWKTKEIFNIPLQKGKQILRVNFHGGEFNLGKMIFDIILHWSMVFQSLKLEGISLYYILKLQHR